MDMVETGDLERAGDGDGPAFSSIPRRSPSRFIGRPGSSVKVMPQRACLLGTMAQERAFSFFPCAPRSEGVMAKRMSRQAGTRAQLDRLGAQDLLGDR